MYKINKMGPSIDLCRILILSGKHAESTPLHLTYWKRLFKKDKNIRVTTKGYC